MALASTLCVPKNAYLLRTDSLYSSAWSYRTGKRIRSSLELSGGENSETENTDVILTVYKERIQKRETE